LEGSVKYRKKPVVIDAMQFTDNASGMDIALWVTTSDPETEVRWNSDGSCLLIPTFEGIMRADSGDWIIRGVKGEFYPCKPDIFEATYEEVN